ncbi:MAG: ATP-binding protein, partial [Acidimicrobiales bacterium]
PVNRGDGSSSVALVASYPTSLVADTRDELFKILFLIALGGTVLALGLASLVGARIGARLRLLTEAAGALRRGEAVPRIGIESDDEVGVLSTTFDAMARAVADKTAAESALRSRLEAVFKGMGEAMVALDAGGQVTVFNPAAEALLGIGAVEAVGRPVEEVVRLSDERGRSLADELRSPQRWTGRGFVEVGGVAVPVAVSVGTLDMEGVDRAGSVVLRDLRAEEQVERMKTQILNRTSHEFRHPLTPIMAYGKMLAREPVAPETVRKWGAEIARAGDELFRIVLMMEFFSQRMGGRLHLQRERVDPGVLVDDVVKRWRSRLDRPRAITRQVNRRLPAVYLDRTQISRCLDELVDNAAKFSPRGVRIVVGAEAGPGGSVILSVTDTGIGMTETEKSEAFVRFGQADASDTREYGGLGLGLAFVQEVVQAHGGTTSCESAPGSGSKILMKLPAVPREGRQ